VGHGVSVSRPAGIVARVLLPRRGHNVNRVGIVASAVAPQTIEVAVPDMDPLVFCIMRKRDKKTMLGDLPDLVRCLCVSSARLSVNSCACARAFVSCRAVVQEDYARTFSTAKLPAPFEVCSVLRQRSLCRSDVPSCGVVRLPHSQVVSESAEATALLLSSDVETAIRKSERYFGFLHATDQGPVSTM
jgi:hypothetical protein